MPSKRDLARYQKYLRTQREAARYKQYAKVISRFRPRKTERSQYVYIGLNGERLDAKSRKVGFLVYVKKDGTKKIFNKQITGKIYKPVKPSSLSQRKVRKINPSAYDKKFRVQLAPTHFVKTLIEPSYEQLINRVVNEVVKDAKGRKKYRRYNARLELWFAKERRKSIVASGAFTMGDDMILPDHPAPVNRKSIFKFFLNGLHSQIKPFLLAQDDGYVTRGSAEWVREFFDREGRLYFDPDTGKEWVGNGKGRVVIKKAAYEVIHIRPE